MIIREVRDRLRELNYHNDRILALNAELLGKPTSEVQSGELNRVIVLH